MLFREEGAAHYARLIVTASRCRLSVANLLEAAIVVGRRGDSTDVELDLFVKESGIELAAVTVTATPGETIAASDYSGRWPTPATLAGWSLMARSYPARQW